MAEDEPFSHFGLDSATAVGLLNRLEQISGPEAPGHFGMEISHY